MPLEVYQSAYRGKGSEESKLVDDISSLTLRDDQEGQREQTVYERNYEAPRLLEGLAPRSGSFVNGVWTERGPDEGAKIRVAAAAFAYRHGRDATSVVFAAARRRDDAVLNKWHRLSSRLALRDLFRASTTTPQTPAKASRTDDVSPIGVEEFDPDDPIPDDACAICFSSLSKGAVTLPCGHRFHESCVRCVYAYQQACPLCRDETPLQLTPRRRTDEDVYGVPVDQWEPRHFRVTGTCSKCGESIYAGQHRTRWRYQYHTYRCPDAETNAVIRALAPEHDWINAPEPPTLN